MELALKVLQAQLEQKAADAFAEAADYIGVDNYADIFRQGKGQAYRDAAKLVSEMLSKM